METYTENLFQLLKELQPVNQQQHARLEASNDSATKTLKHGQKCVKKFRRNIQKYRAALHRANMGKAIPKVQHRILKTLKSAKLKKSRRLATLKATSTESTTESTVHCESTSIAADTLKEPPRNPIETVDRETMYQAKRRRVSTCYKYRDYDLQLLSNAHTSYRASNARQASHKSKH